MIKQFLFLLLIIFPAVSCKSLYGIKPQEKFDENKIQQFYSNIPPNIHRAVADSSYIKNIKAVLKNDSTYRYYHLQPLQAMYFNADGKMISYHVNCNAGGFPKLKWNRNGLFETFPPDSQTPPNENISLRFLTDHIKLQSPLEKADYTIFVFWNLLMEKQSRILIGEVMDNVRLTDKKLNLILVNNDKWYLK